MPGKLPDALGQPGLQHNAGYLAEEFLLELRDVRGRRALREMADNDPVIGGLLFAIEHLIRQVDWTLAPADDSPEAQDVADFVDECLHDMEDTWADTLAEILSMAVFGWVLLEVLYKLRGGMETDDPTEYSAHDDGRIGWRAWSIRGQESLQRWDFDPDTGALRGMWQLPPPTYKLCYIPLDKALLFRTTVRKGNPEGRSLLRNAWSTYRLKKQVLLAEAIGITRDLAGIPVGWVPAEFFNEDASTDQKATVTAFEKIVTSLHQDEQSGLLMPLAYDEHGNKLYDLTLMSAAGSRQFDTDKVLQRYDTRLLIVCLADWILLGHQQVGSFALSSDKTDMFAVGLGAILDSIAAVPNRRAIPQLLRLNGIAMDLRPELRHGDIERAELADLADFLTKLSGAGATIFPNPELEQYLFEQAGLPAPVEPDEDPLAGDDLGMDDTTGDLDPEVAALMAQLAGGGVVAPVVPASQVAREPAAQLFFNKVHDDHGRFGSGGGGSGGHTIREADVAAFTKGSKVTEPTYHATSARAAAAITKDGIDFERNKAAMYGSGFYTATAQSKEFGGTALKVVHNIKKPVEGKSMVDAMTKIDTITKGEQDPKAIRRKLLAAGYDGVIIHNVGPTPKDRWVLGLRPESVRVVVP